MHSISQGFQNVGNADVETMSSKAPSNAVQSCSTALSHLVLKPVVQIPSSVSLYIGCSLCSPAFSEEWRCNAASICREKSSSKPMPGVTHASQFPSDNGNGKGRNCVHISKCHAKLISSVERQVWQVSWFEVVDRPLWRHSQLSPG